MDKNIVLEDGRKMRICSNLFVRKDIESKLKGFWKHFKYWTHEVPLWNGNIYRIFQNSPMRHISFPRRRIYLINPFRVDIRFLRKLREKKHLYVFAMKCLEKIYQNNIFDICPAGGQKKLQLSDHLRTYC